MLEHEGVIQYVSATLRREDGTPHELRSYTISAFTDVWDPPRQLWQDPKLDDDRGEPFVAERWHCVWANGRISEACWADRSGAINYARVTGCPAVVQVTRTTTYTAGTPEAV